MFSTYHCCTAALLLSKTGTGISLGFSQQQYIADDASGEQPLQVQLLIDFLANNHNQLQIGTPRHCWCWDKR